MSMINQIVRDCQAKPKVLRLFEPKAGAPNARYTSTKKLSALLMFTAELVDGTLVTELLPAAFPVCYRPICEMVAQGMPMIFVKRELAESALRAEPTGDFDFTQLQLPHEAGILVLPKETLVHPVHGDCSWIGWGRFSGTKDYAIPGLSKRPFAGGPDGMAVFTAALDDRELPFFHFTAVDDGQGGKRFRVPDVMAETPLAPGDVADAVDEAFVGRMILLAFQLLLAGDGRPATVQ